MPPEPASAVPAAGWELGSPMRRCRPLTASNAGVAVLGPPHRELARAEICAICSPSAVVLWMLSTAAAAMRLAAM
eukprot:9708117-Heterocapsa_arctica.AAC.1